MQNHISLIFDKKIKIYIEFKPFFFPHLCAYLFFITAIFYSILFYCLNIFKYAMINPKAL